MLELLLTARDGGTAWRHLFAPGQARAGWECVGPLGLAKRLGRLFGVRGEPAPHAERVSAYATRLAELDDGARSFSRSRASDPWGVASYLLALRDRLRAGEWDGGALAGSPRPADLPEPLPLRIAGPEAAFEPIVRSVVAALATRGATVEREGDEAPSAP